MSLSGLAKQIHQVWVVVRILRGLTAESLSLYFKQGFYHPMAVVGNCALWYEFDLNPHTKCDGILWYSFRGRNTATEAHTRKGCKA